MEVLLNGTPDQKRKLIREYLTGESESSSGDEFEKEMEAELSSTIKSMEGTWAPAASGVYDWNSSLKPLFHDLKCFIVKSLEVKSVVVLIMCACLFNSRQFCDQRQYYHSSVACGVRPDLLRFRF